MFNKYGCVGCVKLLINFLLTKLIFPNARLIRFPIDIRGRRYILVGKGFTTGRGCRIEACPVENNGKTIFIGKNVQINDYVHITGASSVIIDDDVLIASKVYISDCTHGRYSGENQSHPSEVVAKRPLFCEHVHIKRNVWIGDNVSILPGVVIGENSVIGANSVVSKSVPANVIVAGVPAKVIKKYDEDLKSWVKV